MQQDLRNTGKLGNSSRDRIKAQVREMRKNQTEAEKIVWKIVRNRNLNGYKFLRQHPIIYGFYKRPLYFVADFYCAEKKLVLEVDGSIHQNTKEYDYQREFVLKQKGLKVLRIKNEELVDIEKVKRKILIEIAQTCSPSLCQNEGAGGEF